MKTSKRVSEIPIKFGNVVLEKKGEMSWTNHVRNEAVLQRVKEERNIPQTIKRKAKWFCHILHRNCPLKTFLVVVMLGVCCNISVSTW